MPHLEDISTEQLCEILTEVETERAAKRVKVGLRYKQNEEITVTELAEDCNMSVGWVSRWLRRLERLNDEPFEVVIYDDPRSGRPSKLSAEEYNQFVQAVQQQPQEHGYDSRRWTTSLAQEFLRSEFGVDYSIRHTRRLLSKAGLSPVTTHEPVQGVDEDIGEMFEPFSQAQSIWIVEQDS